MTRIRNFQWLYVIIIVLMVIYFIEYNDNGSKESVKEPKIHNEDHFNDLTIHDSQTSYETEKMKASDESKIIVRPVEVNVNYLQKFHGLEINKELYVPFSFLKEYYEISGEFLNTIETDYNDDESLHFLWLHVNSTRLNVKKLSFQKYNVEGAYLTSSESDVSNRARVKCISGIYEVPITTQWDPNGYFYPTQIAQYGLSHISKFFVNGKRKPKQRNLKLSTPNFKGEYEVKSSNLFTLKVKFNQSLSGFKIIVLASDNKEYHLIYKTDDTMIKRSDTKTKIFHGIGKNLNVKHVLTRDLQVDLVKGLSFMEGKKAGNTVSTKVKKIISIVFDEIETVSSVKLLDQDHEAKFMAAADWFLKFQDNNGGWKVNVRRVIFRGMEADSGWYSAMGQGQAISLLSRVFSYTKDERYLKAALAATKVFHKMSSESGVKAMLFNTLPWYEEYPTTPPSFVLNGFIYSLFGLYDLGETSDAIKARDVMKLFNEGFSTLEKALPLFDNGHGSFYDLRHISIPGHEPNRARWQYHRIHLEQLSALISITDSKILKNVLARWTGYASGVLSRHN